MGDYERAGELVSEVLRLQSTNRATSHLPFGELVLAEICARRLDWENALDWHNRGLRYLAQADHVYREMATALHACAIAGIHLRRNEADEALVHLRRSWSVVRESPRMMAHDRLLTRTMAGMAGASAALGERGKAEEQLNKANQHLETALLNPGGYIHGVETFELCHALGVAHVRLNQPGAARALLAKAVEKGLRDYRRLESDPELAPLQTSGDLQPLVDLVRRFPPLHFGATRCVTTSNYTAIVRATGSLSRR